jgi:hypothetical protein
MGAIVRAPSREGCGLPLRSAGEDGLAPPVVDIRRRDVVEPLVVPVLEIDEGGQRGVQPPGACTDEQVQPGLERLVKTRELALGLRVMRRAVDMPDAEPAEVVFKRLRQVARAPVRQQARAVSDRRLR